MRNIYHQILRAAFLLMAVAAIQGTISGQAQMPNGDFEQWTGNKPTGWDATNLQVSIFTIQTVFKDSVAPKSGMYNPLLETKVFNLLVATPTIPGILTLGTVVVNTTTFTGSVEGGIPFTGRPSSLSGYIKTQPAAGDSGMVALGLSKWNGTSRDTIGEGLKWFPNTDTTSWQPFSVPIQWSSTQNPDSLNIIISSSAVGNEVFVAGSRMRIDSLMFNYGPISVEIPFDNRQLTVWADGGNTLHYSLPDEEIAAKVSVFNLNGSEVLVHQATTRGNLHLGTLPAGLYILYLTTENGLSFSRKFVLR